MFVVMCVCVHCIDEQFGRWTANNNFVGSVSAA